MKKIFVEVWRDLKSPFMHDERMDVHNVGVFLAVGIAASAVAIGVAVGLTGKAVGRLVKETGINFHL